MGDGRHDSGRLTQAIEQHSQRHILFDMEEIARRSGAIVNAVMLGAIAGCGRLPIPADAFERAIRADGKAVEANLRGFRAGLEAAAQASAARRMPESRKRSAGRRARRSRARDHRGDVDRRPRHDPGRRAPARRAIRTSNTRSSISTGWRRSASPTSARAPPARLLREVGAPPRGAHVL